MVHRWRRGIVFGILLILFLCAVLTIVLNPHARALLHHPQELGHATRAWTAEHGWAAEITLLVLYILLTLVAMPVWWLNILAGFSFGLIGGSIRCVIASAIAAAITAELWKWLAADIADHKLFSRFKILHMLHHYAEDGAFLVVFLSRMAHLLPFGLSNYIFGMLGIRFFPVFFGTLLGGIPSVVLYVSLGAGRDWHSHPIFIAIIGLLAIGGLITGGIIYARHRAQETKAAADQEAESP